MELSCISDTSFNSLLHGCLTLCTQYSCPRQNVRVNVKVESRFLWLNYDFYTCLRSKVQGQDHLPSQI